MRACATSSDSNWPPKANRSSLSCVKFDSRRRRLAGPMISCRRCRSMRVQQVRNRRRARVQNQIFGGEMKRILLCAAYVMTTLGASAQMMPNPYGMSVNLDTAKKLAAAAVAEASKKGFKMAVAVTDTNGDLVYFEKMDSTQIASVQVSIQKAASATLYKRPTKKLQDALAAGGVGLRVLRLDRAIPVEGGLPLVSADGKIIGAIGCSGDTSENDGIVCQAGADTLHPPKWPDRPAQRLCNSLSCLLLRLGLGEHTARRHAARQPGVTANRRAAADRHPPQNGCARIDDDVVLDDRVARIALLQFSVRADCKAARPQRDRLIQPHPIPDHGGFSDHNPGAVVDEKR